MSEKPVFHHPREVLASGAISTYYEFINTPTLSSGIYTLGAGEIDQQKPHAEDELYYVLTGKSSMVVGDTQFQVRAGDVIFVPASLEHRFYDIMEELKLLVFFSKALV